MAASKTISEIDSPDAAPTTIAQRYHEPGMNRWNIPGWLELEVLARDTQCIYCGVGFAATAMERRGRPSWEHIINDAKIVTRENIARCCMGCNASKGTRPLAAWLESKYCQSRGITAGSVAAVARAVLAPHPERRT